MSSEKQLQLQKNVIEKKNKFIKYCEPGIIIGVVGFRP